uniref:Transketolase n=1 Tax=Thermosporothrix sp. COM3 TaxID=2490863 RepID=A0A455SEQ6_9CHLR|nr:transketolase [Thermosporothrix sp. COM3]
MSVAIEQRMRHHMKPLFLDILGRDPRTTVVLADISRDILTDVIERYPDRVINVGIMEQTMISAAAGLALEGFIPIVHTLTPFLVERPYEQLKDDFIYQRLGGNFISSGASYDYSIQGMTHHGPADVALLRNLPGMQIVVPGTTEEFDSLFRQAYANGAPTYYRLSTEENPAPQNTTFGKLTIVQRGTQATVIAVGPMLGRVLEAVGDLDVTVLYCTTVAPFDAETLHAEQQGDAVILVEPYYEGALVPEITAALEDRPVRIKAIGVPHQILSRYGTYQQHNEALGLTARGIRDRITRFLQQPTRQ